MKPRKFHEEGVNGRMCYNAGCRNPAEKIAYHGRVRRYVCHACWARRAEALREIKKLRSQGLFD